jgi:hypothetical protein
MRRTTCRLWLLTPWGKRKEREAVEYVQQKLFSSLGRSPQERRQRPDLKYNPLAIDEDICCFRSHDAGSEGRTK